MDGTPLAAAIKKSGGQTALAEAIGRSQTTISDWFKRGWPSPEACPAIEAATGVSAAELLQPAMARKLKKRRKRKAA